MTYRDIIHQGFVHQGERPSYDGILSDIIAYEEGVLDEEGTLRFFQKLVDTGLAWTLQGHYGRTAQDLIDAGLIDLEPTKET